MDFTAVQERRRHEQVLFIQSLGELIERRAEESGRKRWFIVLLLFWEFPILIQSYVGLNLTRHPIFVSIANFVFSIVGRRWFRFKFLRFFHALFRTLEEIVEAIKIFVIVRAERREILALLFEKLMRQVLDQIQCAYVVELEAEVRSSGFIPPPPTMAQLFTPREIQDIHRWTDFVKKFKFWWDEIGGDDM